MNTSVKRALANPFFRYNAISFVGSVAVAALNYLYYPVLGRLLHPADFGEVQAINSLYLQSTVFMSVFSVVIVNIVSKHSDSKIRQRILAELEKAAFIVTLSVMLVLVAASSGLANFFHFGTVYPLFLLLLCLLLSVPFTFRNAFLQGKRDFIATAKTGALSASAKIFFSALFVILGWKAFGAVFGMVIAQGLALLYLIYLVRERGWLKLPDFSRASLPDLRLIQSELKFAALVLVATLSFNVFLSLDILAVKHWFSPTTAGLYGGIETLGRIVFYMSISVAGVLLPSVSGQKDPKENRRLLYRSVLLTGALGLAVLTAFLLVPREIVSILMGKKFLVYIYLLPRLGLFTFLASLINLFVTYHLAQRRAFIAVAMALGVAVTLLWLTASHATVASVVTSLIFGALSTLVLIAGLSWLWPKSSRLFKVRLSRPAREEISQLST
ncbi:MAG TPA: oligosaccharide flippase family protein [Candidatus Saccharimonadia bacterium]|nr:oligosaccharide flippase family protein [Candidatus Saccharimonadia bacterium]